MKNLLVTLANNYYLDQVKQVFSSAYFNAGWRGDCLLLAYHIPEDKKEWFKERGIESENISDTDLEWFKERGIKVKKCEPFYDKKIGFSPPVVLAKLYLFAEGFKQWDQIIFLDGDILIRDSIDALTEVNGLGAVRIMSNTRSKFLGQFWNYDAGWIKKMKKKYNLKGPALNSGVLAFSTDIIKPDTLDQFRAIMDEYGNTLGITEEAILNIHFHNNWIELPAVYNVCPNWEMGFRRCRPNELKGIILHNYSWFFPKPRKMWWGGNPLYKEWKASLVKADQVDFKKPAPIKTTHRQEIIKDSELLLRLPRRHPIRFLARHILNSFEAKRQSKNKFWKMLVALKDVAYRISQKLVV